MINSNQKDMKKKRKGISEYLEYKVNTEFSMNKQTITWNLPF